MKFTLIGGGGYIGQPLAEHLTDKGHKVVIIDNFNYEQNDNLGDDIEIINDDVLNITRHSAHLTTSNYVF